MTNKVIRNLRKTTKTDVLEQKVVKPLVGNELDPKYGNRSIGYQDFNGQDPIPRENKPQEETSTKDGTYKFAEIIDGIREPKLPSEGLGTVEECQDTEDSTLNLLLKPNGIFTDNASEVATFIYFEQNVLANYPGVLAEWQYSTVDEVLDQLDTIITGPGYTPERTGPPELVDLDSILTTPEKDDQLYDVWDFTNYVAYRQEYELQEAPGTFLYYYVLGILSSYSLQGGSNDTLEFPGMSPSSPNMFDAWNVRDELTLDTTTQILQLAWQQNNVYWIPDPDFVGTPLKYTLNLSVIPVKFDTTYDRYGWVIPTKAGGMILYETTTSSPNTPTGFARVYNPDRTLLEIIPAAQIFTQEP